MSDDMRPGDVPSYPRRDQGGPFGGPQGGPQAGPGGTWQSGPASGPRLFPFPSWTTRTRGGSTVTVGGCCLPLPLGCLTTTVLVGAVAGTRAVRRLRG